VEIDDGTIRPYHVGDSEILVTGQRGRLKLQIVPHSPTGYGVESGLLDEEAAIVHEDRHFVSNVVGSREMRIEVGPTLRARPRDTVLLASDGLFDNLRQEEILEIVRCGPLAKVAEELAGRTRARMKGAEPRGKPDDLTFVLWRPLPSSDAKGRTGEARS
jgi:serine/threonine protein phosphatase PrpC